MIPLDNTRPDIVLTPASAPAFSRNEASTNRSFYGFPADEQVATVDVTKEVSPADALAIPLPLPHGEADDYVEVR